jgi:ribosomal protein S4E
MQSRTEAHLSELRFRKGEHVCVHEGAHVGKSGVVEEILIDHHFAYLIQPASGEAFQASDAQVELQNNTP